MPVLTRLLAALALVMPGMAQLHAQTFPTAPVRVIVPLAAGGAADVITRAITERLGSVWGQSIVIENRTGAGTNLGAELVARAAPDGLTLLSTSEATVVANPFMYQKMSFDPLKDLVPVSGLGLVNQLLIVHPSVPAKTFAEFVAMAKAQPGALSFATFGIGSSGHLNMELLMARAGIKLTPVHYRGGAPALVDVIGGHVKSVVISTTLSQGPWKAGQVKALGAGSLKRLPQFPDLPTIAESGVPGYRSVSWFGLFAPAGTPAPVIAKINTDVQRVLANADFKAKFLDPQQFEPITGDPQAFAAMVKSEAEQWSRVIKGANIRID